MITSITLKTTVSDVPALEILKLKTPCKKVEHFKAPME